MTFSTPIFKYMSFWTYTQFQRCDFDNYSLPTSNRHVPLNENFPFKLFMIVKKKLQLFYFVRVPSPKSPNMVDFFVPDMPYIHLQ